LTDNPSYIQQLCGSCP